MKNLQLYCRFFFLIKLKNMKICRVCKVEKELSEFHKKKDTKDGHRNECKECVKEINKKYKDPEKTSEYDKKRYQKKRKEILERKKEYYVINKEVLLEKKREYYDNVKIRLEHNKYMRDYQKDPKNKEVIYRYRRNNPHIIIWRSILYRTLKYFGKKKELSTLESLGYNSDELRLNIESKFKEGMTWDNYGEWEVDHIFPLSKFDKDTPVDIVNSLQNLQPLWFDENRSKSNNI